MQAITVKYLKATSKKGARLKATCKSSSITIAYPYHLSRDLGIYLAAQQLQFKMDWGMYKLVSGTLPNEDTVFVLAKE